METYITVSFWLLATVSFIQLFTVSTSEYPRRRSHSMGEDVANILFNLPFILWAAYLLWA